MHIKNSSYFFAIVLPQPLAELVEEFKLSFKERFGCVAALKSPAHITLQPPFSFTETDEERLVEKVQRFCLDRNVFHVDLKNFGAFPPRTIFIDVVPSESLFLLQNELCQFLKNESLINQNQIENMPFSPHVTVANRDISRDDFEIAWEEYKGGFLEAGFDVKRISLLKHNGTAWDVLKSFPFCNNSRPSKH